MKKIRCLITPCPNDTLAILPWLLGKIEYTIPITCDFSALEMNNHIAKSETKYDLIKLSYANYERFHEYEPIAPGSAITSKKWSYDNM